LTKSSVSRIIQAIWDAFALAPAVITVTLATDPKDAPNNGLTLRQAIQLTDGTLLKGNLAAGQKALVDGDPARDAKNTIIFKIGNANETISVQNTPLPEITHPTIINGVAPSKDYAEQTITIDGEKLGQGKKEDYIPGFVLTAGSSKSAIYGLTIQNFYDDGISIYSSDNNIGGSNPGQGNIIQKNGIGVHIRGNSLAGGGGDNNTLVGNFIRDNVFANATDTTRQRGDTGVLIDGGATKNVIGKNVTKPDLLDSGVIKNPANVITGNENLGISIQGASNNYVFGNFIGLLKDGATASANVNAGIKIADNSAGNVIGGMEKGKRNTISGNTFYGILVEGAQATNNKIDGNYIGTKPDGTNGNVGNAKGGAGSAGIAFTKGANGNNVYMNRIEYNGGPGVLKTDVGTKQNLVFDPNSIAFNGYGIDDGVPDGPVLNSATVSSNTITVQGTLAGDPNTSYLLEFFGNTTEDPSGYGEGEFYLGNTTVTTDDSGNASFNVTFNAVYGSYVSATATNTATGGYTTEFSNDVPITGESQNASVSGEVWDDANTNGLLDSGESGVANVSVQLFTSLGSLVASTTTDANGNYNFSNVTPGDYYLQFISPSGYIFTPPYQGDDTISSHADPTTGDTEPFTLIAGEEDPFINAGVIPTSAQPSTSTTIASDLNSSAYGTPVTFTATVTQTDSIPLGGTVTFMDGDNVLGTVELDPGADGYQAVFTASNLSLGDHTITAIYNGDGFHLGSSASMTQTITQAPTVTSVVSSNNPSLPGQAVTFTASVSAAYDTPTGTVTFYDGSTELDTETLDANGNATYTTSTLALGSHDIIAEYSGDSNFESSSGSLTQVISQENSDSVYLISSPYLSSALNQPVTFTARIYGSNVTPTGSVTFMDGDNVLETVTLDANGTATYTTSALASGSHTIIAVYSGDATYAGNSGSLTQWVYQTPTNTSVNADYGVAQVGQLVTFTATVSADGTDYSGMPTGTVAFLDGTTVLDTAPLDANGNATFATSSLSSGNHTIIAVYSGDANFIGSSGSNLETVGQASGISSSVSVGSSAVSPLPGQNVTFTATVNDFNGGIPTGTVTFLDDTTVLGTAPVDANGNATFMTSLLGLGNHDIIAVYSGDSTYISSAGTLTQAVVQASSTTSLSSSANPSSLGQPVTFTATVAAVDPSAGVPMGTVSFYDGTTFLGSGTLDANGNATFTTSMLGWARMISSPSIPAMTSSPRANGR
jgi:hypothetical protein